MKRNQLIAVGMSLLMTAGMLAGCGGSGNSSTGTTAGTTAKSASSAAATTAGTTAAGTKAAGTTAATKKEAKVDQLEVKIWDSKQKDGIQEICDDWSKKSGVKVNVEVVDWDNYWTLLEAGASGGEMPDVFWMHSNYIQKYMGAGLLLDLSDYIKKDDAIDLKNYYEDITKIYQSDGKQYAIPKDYDTIALWYNKKMFDAAGLSYPDNTWTWKTMQENAAKLNKADGSQYGMTGNTDQNQEFYYNVIYSYGGYVIDDAHKKSGYDDPKTLEAMNEIGKMISSGMAPQSVLAETGNFDLFTSNMAAMSLFGSWYVASLKQYDNAADWGIAELPYCDVNGNGSCDSGERVSIYNGLGWAASKATKDPDTTYSLISYLCSKEGQEKQAKLGVTMSAYKGTSDQWKNNTNIWDLSPYLKEAEGDAKLVIMPYSKSTTWAEEAKQSLVAAWQDPTQMETICKQIAESMNAELKQE